MDQEEETWKTKLKRAILPCGPQAIAEPEKELRFTRSAQARLFYGVAVVFFAISMGVFILSTQDWGMKEPILNGWLWLCIPGLLITYLFLRIALRCTRHAYVIFSPLGVEIFPFLKPQKNLQIVYWSEVADVEVSVDYQRMTLHFSKEKKSGVIVSLSPISKKLRPLLKQAVLGVMDKKNKPA